MISSSNICRRAFIHRVPVSLPLLTRWIWATRATLLAYSTFTEAANAAISAEISGATYTDEQIAETMREVWKKDHYLLDPHGACGFRALVEGLKLGETGVFLETAHPAKFKDTVEKIIGEAVEIPAEASGLYAR